MSKPTIVFVHGAWHHPAHFEPLSRALESHDYQTRRAALASVIDKGTSPPEDIRCDIIAVKEAIEDVLREGSNVLVVTHSYGGVPTVSAVKGLDAATRTAAGHDNHVIGIAAIASFLPAEGETLCTAVNLPDTDPGTYPSEGDITWLAPDTIHDMMYGDLSKDEAAHWGSLLRPMARKPLYLSKSEYSAHKHLPIHFLFCSQDHAMFPDLQRLTIEKLRKDGADVRVEEIDADHSPYLGHVERTSDFVRRSAGENIPHVKPKTGDREAWNGQLPNLE